MRLLLPIFILFTYVVASLIWPLPLRPLAKIAAAAVLFLISAKFLIYMKIGRSFIAPGLPTSLQLVMEVLFSALIILAFLLLIKDAIAIFLWIGRQFGSSWHLPFSATSCALLLVAVSLVLALYGLRQSLRVPEVHTVEVHLDRLPPQLDGFSIVQLTDIHIGPFLKKTWLEQVVAKTNAISPDLVVLTGDLIDGSPQQLKDDVAPFGMLRAKHGVFGITGNHEYYFHVHEWLPVFKQLGITMLHNEHQTLSIKDSNLIVAGVPDEAEIRFGGPGPDPEKAFAGAPPGIHILLQHRPEPESHQAIADLQLSGHTHGGHLFFLKWLIGSHNGGLVCGLYEKHGAKIYISPGTGVWAGFSCRLGVPSEITRIILRAPHKD